MTTEEANHLKLDTLVYVAVRTGYYVVCGIIPRPLSLASTPLVEVKHLGSQLIERFDCTHVTVVDAAFVEQLRQRYIQELNELEKLIEYHKQ